MTLHQRIEHAFRNYYLLEMGNLIPHYSGDRTTKEIKAIAESNNEDLVKSYCMEVFIDYLIEIL